MLNNEQIDYLKSKLIESGLDDSWININYSTWQVIDTMDVSSFETVESDDYYIIYQVGDRYFKINHGIYGKRRGFESIEEVFRKERISIEVYYE